MKQIDFWATFMLLMGMVACGGNTANEDNASNGTEAGQSATQGEEGPKEPDGHVMLFTRSAV